MAIRLEDTLVGYPERIRSLAEVESVIKKAITEIEKLPISN